MYICIYIYKYTYIYVYVYTWRVHYDAAIFEKTRRKESEKSAGLFDLNDSTDERPERHAASFGESASFSSASFPLCRRLDT